jgi:hypothetical protein
LLDANSGMKWLSAGPEARRQKPSIIQIKSSILLFVTPSRSCSYIHSRLATSSELVMVVRRTASHLDTVNEKREIWKIVRRINNELRHLSTNKYYHFSDKYYRPIQDNFRTILGHPVYYRLKDRTQIIARSTAQFRTIFGTILGHPLCVPVERSYTNRTEIVQPNSGFGTILGHATLLLSVETSYTNRTQIVQQHYLNIYFQIPICIKLDFLRLALIRAFITLLGAKSLRTVL